MNKNIFVLGLDNFNRELLGRLRDADAYNFVPLLTYDEIVKLSRPLNELLPEAAARLRAFPGSVDAIVSYWDFPSCTILPILRAPFGLPGPSLEAVLKCEHKYWSRLEQVGVVGEHVPQFRAVDPFAHDPLAGIPLAFPFWIKPVKAHSSHLGFMVRDADELHRAISAIRQGIHRLAEPFNHILGHAELPPEIAKVDGWHCIAEEIISAGRQCTLEGYVFRGDVEVYGVVDSIREGEHRSCFARYQYPSRMPKRIQQRMIDVARRFLEHVGYDDAPFNMEFYWNERRDEISLLEVNTRISKSHCPLFEMVDGASHQEVMIDVALGRRPEFPHRKGEYRTAAKFMLRVFEDGIVTRLPRRDDLERARRLFPDTRVRLMVEEGLQLSHLPLQDSYSFELAEIFMGARDQKQLRANFRQCLEVLDFRYEPSRPEAA